jgi:ELWxxDGT repeat protein
VKEIRPGVHNSLPSHFVVLHDTLFFAATDGAHGVELWRSDGTAEGTAMVKDIAPGAAGSSPAHLVVIGARLEQRLR